MPTPSLSAPFTPPVKKEVPLPAGWVEVQTLGGKTYYYNKELKTTAWSVETIERMRAQKQELCAGTKAEDAKAPDTQAAATVTSDDPSCPGMQAVQEVVPLPAGWVEVQTLGGRAYYYNEELKTTAWSVETIERMRAQKQELCAGTKAEDAKAPDTQAAATVTSDDPSYPGMQAVQEVVPLPAGWVERHTLGGRAYYYNEELRTTAMKRPTSAKAR